MQCPFYLSHHGGKPGRLVSVRELADLGTHDEEYEFSDPGLESAVNVADGSFITS